MTRPLYFPDASEALDPHTVGFILGQIHAEIEQGEPVLARLHLRNLARDLGVTEFFESQIEVEAALQARTAASLRELS